MVVKIHYKKCTKPTACLHMYFFTFLNGLVDQCTSDIPIKPINWPINRYRPINQIGKSQKLQYRIGIGSANYKGPYWFIGMGIKRAHIGAKLVKFEPLKKI